MREITDQTRADSVRVQTALAAEGGGVAALTLAKDTGIPSDRVDAALAFLGAGVLLGDDGLWRAP